jgi:hypothetical protein
MPEYLTVLAALHGLEKPRTYLEIGVRAGDSFRAARRETFYVGVDPDPFEPCDAAQLCHLEKATSNDLFSGGRAGDSFGDRPLDMAFIDNMHALRYFANIECYSHKKTRVVVHHLSALDAVTASRDRATEDRTGDIGKLPLVFTDHRPDLELSLIDSPPTGLGLTRGLDASSPVLRDSQGTPLQDYGSLASADREGRERDLAPGLVASKESARWRRRLLRQVSLSHWQGRASRPVRSLLAIDWFRRSVLPFLRRGGIIPTPPCSETESREERPPC